MGYIMKIAYIIRAGAINAQPTRFKYLWNLPVLSTFGSFLNIPDISGKKARSFARNEPFRYYQNPVICLYSAAAAAATASGVFNSPANILLSALRTVSRMAT